ncbi:Mammalian cell entry related domain protein [Segniliparus rotundus DSM 44985]|uniref:Mammalian cell entry related domain protein n=1 Tax=Segniliparus rotundus (strain ATCC BAA-972 / CDC 1076 / CIP 108378 / DSM 44985 / JCM 13578) TaxID=640132 RepID=D6Z975_SEGRD|nr:MlaD family protein [Segniliparus rotundus]ADG98505.1 Mammalian cell entry related domain protein [Segniliparus rotundus DSM 44985]
MAVFQDLSGRAAGRKALLTRGVILVLVVVLLGFLAQQYEAGRFTKTFRIQVETTNIGEGLSVGADVKYRGLIIGKVESIDTRGITHQHMWLTLDAKQAQGLRGITSAKYQSSNIFGAPAIELLSGNSTVPLEEGATVQIDSSGKVASITSALRQIASLTTLLGTDKVQRLLHLVTQNGDILASALQAGFSLGKIYADNLRKPVIDQIRDLTPLVNGVSLVVVPALAAIDTIYESSEFLSVPESRDRTVEALLNHRIMIFDEVGATFDNIKSPGVDAFGTILDIGHPLLMSAGSAAEAWGNLETFLNRVEDAMPSIDGKVKLRLEVLLPASRAMPEPDEQSRQAGAQRQLTPEQQQKVQALQAQILGSVPKDQVAHVWPDPQEQAQAQQQAPQQQGQQQSPDQKQGSGDFASIPAKQSEGGPR